MIFQLTIMIVGYALGMGLIVLLKLIGITLALNNAVILILALPLACVCISEALTLLWTNTPGALGTGGFIAFIPLLIAGVFNAIAALVAQKSIPIDFSSSIRNSENLTGWLVLSFVCCAITLSLWRFWPEPTPKMW